MKRCPHCGELKPIADFHLNRGKSGGRQAWCAACKIAVEKQQRHARGLARFGLTVEDYQAMLAAQGGVCAICGTPPTDRRRLAVDHNHETGAVRGLLCVPCNQALGRFKDSPDVLAAAAMYLLRHENALALAARP
jgi:hypothetical protein